ncbi:MAG: fasciclin domain-containing protein [Actinobacteria bacterium]|nr:MAG: fasciclin domain-containing protein [Actinomycetota bacterium]
MKRLVILIVAAALGASLVAGLATARTAAPVAKAEGDIVQTAVASGQFKTLAKLLTRAGLVSALEQPGPFTVFAPTDAAFKKVPKTTLDALLRNKAKLKAVLLYHVVSGKVTAADVVHLTAAKTLNGKAVRIRVAGSNVFVNKAKVTTPDVMASNGVIHVINRVLLPPTR